MEEGVHFSLEFRPVLLTFGTPAGDAMLRGPLLAIVVAIGRRRGGQRSHLEHARFMTATSTAVTREHINSRWSTSTKEPLCCEFLSH